MPLRNGGMVNICTPCTSTLLNLTHQRLGTDAKLPVMISGVIRREKPRAILSNTLRVLHSPASASRPEVSPSPRSESASESESSSESRSHWHEPRGT
eukprot:1340988-Rhodomonas_salina.2